MARYEYDDQSFVEFDDKWTRGQVTGMFEMKGAEYLDLLRRKIKSLYLDGSPSIETPEDITEEGIDCVDFNVWLWFAQTPIAHVQEMQRLGEAKRRALFATSETETK